MSKLTSSASHYSCLDLVLAAEHVVHLSEVVGVGEKRLRATGGLEVLLQVSLLTQSTHLERK